MLVRVCLLCAILGALSAAPAGAGGGPVFVSQGGAGLLAPIGTVPGGPVRIVPVSISTANGTELEAISTRDGTVLNQLDLVGQWGLPYTPAGAEGLSHNGRTLVLADTQSGFSSPSLFLVIDPHKWRIVDPITIKGFFSFDALSPDGSKLYLIQYKTSTPGALTHYVVRGYDLKTNRLLPGRIADRKQKSWVMQGSPVTRTTSADGRWVYTLYQNPGGYPFIHALDTVRGVAHCVGLPMSNQGGIYNLILGLHGRTLSVHSRSGRSWLNLDTQTWRLAPAGGGFPWFWVGLGGGAALIAIGVAVFAVRRWRRPARTLDEELGELLGARERELVA
jgi:hypothetical protein